MRRWPRWTPSSTRASPTSSCSPPTPGVFYSDDGAIFRAMQQTAKNGGLIMMHAENGMAIDVVAAQNADAGNTDPYYHGVSRSPVMEGEATNRVIRLAQVAGVPVYIVHLSAREALDEVAPRPRRGAAGLRRDLPAVPVPDARGHGQRLRGRQVRVLAAAAPGRARAGAVEGPRQGRPPGRRRPITARSTSTARRTSARATSARCPTACPGSRTASTCFTPAASSRGTSRRIGGSRSSAPRRHACSGSRAQGRRRRRGRCGPRRLRPRRASTPSAPTTHHMDVDYSCYEGREVTGRRGRRAVTRQGHRGR